MEKVWIIQKISMNYSCGEYDPKLEILGVFSNEDVALDNFFAEKSEEIETCRELVPDCKITEASDHDVTIEDEETFDFVRLILSEHLVV